MEYCCCKEKKSTTIKPCVLIAPLFTLCVCLAEEEFDELLRNANIDLVNSTANSHPGSVSLFFRITQDGQMTKDELTKILTPQEAQWNHDTKSIAATAALAGGMLARTQLNQVVSVKLSTESTVLFGFVRFSSFCRCEYNNEWLIDCWSELLLQ